MAILIKNMQMPECCVTCPTFENDDEGGYCKALEEYMDWDEIPNGRREDCPLVEYEERKE